MELKGVRTLNLIGTIIFPIFSIGIVVIYIPFFLPLPGLRIEEFFNICFSFALVWIVVIIFFTYMLYRNTVAGLDKGDFRRARQWSLFGMFSGFLLGGGPIVVIIFFTSYSFIDDVTRPRYYRPPPGFYPPPYGFGGPYQRPPMPYSQYPTYGMSCPNCGKPIEENWKYCPSCYEKLK
jgi:hypothetical protein